MQSPQAAPPGAGPDSSFVSVLSEVCLPAASSALIPASAADICDASRINADDELDASDEDEDEEKGKEEEAMQMPLPLQGCQEDSSASLSALVEEEEEPATAAAHIQSAADDAASVISTIVSDLSAGSQASESDAAEGDTIGRVGGSSSGDAAPPSPVSVAASFLNDSDAAFDLPAVDAAALPEATESAEESRVDGSVEATEPAEESRVDGSVEATEPAEESRVDGSVEATEPAEESRVDGSVEATEPAEESHVDAPVEIGNQSPMAATKSAPVLADTSIHPYIGQCQENSVSVGSWFDACAVTDTSLMETTMQSFADSDAVRDEFEGEEPSGILDQSQTSKRTQQEKRRRRGRLFHQIMATFRHHALLSEEQITHLDNMFSEKQSRIMSLWQRYSRQLDSERKASKAYMDATGQEQGGSMYPQIIFHGKSPLIQEVAAAMADVLTLALALGPDAESTTTSGRPPRAQPAHDTAPSSRRGSLEKGIGGKPSAPQSRSQSRTKLNESQSSNVTPSTPSIPNTPSHSVRRRANRARRQAEMADAK
jgi:hypothetical protein